MIIINKIILFFKNIFKKDKNIKKLPSSKQNEKTVNSSFADSLKVDNVKEVRKNPPIKTIVCSGDGLGIQNKMSS